MTSASFRWFDTLIWHFPDLSGEGIQNDKNNETTSHDSIAIFVVFLTAIHHRVQQCSSQYFQGRSEVVGRSRVQGGKRGRISSVSARRAIAHSADHWTAINQQDSSAKLDQSECILLALELSLASC